MRRWPPSGASPLSLPGAAASQFWGDGGQPSQHFPLTLSKPRTRTEACETAQPGHSSPSPAPRDSAQSPSVLRLQPLEGGGSPAGQSSLLSHGWGPHSAQSRTCPPGPQGQAAGPMAELGYPRLAGSRQHLWEGGPLHCKLFLQRSLSSAHHPPTHSLISTCLSVVYHTAQVSCMITTWKKENTPPNPATR